MVVAAPEAVSRVLAEIHSGDGLSPAAAGRRFPSHRSTGTVDPSTVLRWLVKGTRTGDGRVVKLEAVRVGGRWLTTGGAVARFVSELTAAADPASAPHPPPSQPAAARRRASAAAAAALKKMGA